MLDRVGKGLRSSPRDALLAASVPPERRGLAFGLHRSMDNAGAVLGPILAAVLLGAFSWFFDKLVLKRLARLNADIKQIGESASTSNRVKDFSGNDEMARLAHGINGMLLRLDESQHALKFEKERA